MGNIATRHSFLKTLRIIELKCLTANSEMRKTSTFDFCLCNYTVS